MIFFNGVGIRLQEALDEVGMKQNFLCKKVKISTATMSALCKGEALPNMKNALKIAKALNKRVEDLWVLMDDEE